MLISSQMEKKQPVVDNTMPETPREPSKFDFSVSMVAGIAILALLLGGVIGYLINQTQTTKDQLQDQPSTRTPTTTATEPVSPATTNGTADWKTYSNPHVPFTFMYPPELQLGGDSADTVGLKNISISLQSMSGDSYVRENSPDYYSFSIDGSAKPEVTIADILDTPGAETLGEKGREELYVDGVIITRGKGMHYWKTNLDKDKAYFGFQDWIFTVYFSSPTIDRTELFKQILSTLEFRYSSIDNTADWKTYSNPHVPFTFMYPPELQLTIDSADTVGVKHIGISLQSMASDTYDFAVNGSVYSEHTVSDFLDEPNVENLEQEGREELHVDGVTITRGKGMYHGALSQDKAYFGYKDWIFTAYFLSPTTERIELFTRILSTFKFLD
jgi:hypothetical protein